MIFCKVTKNPAHFNMNGKVFVVNNVKGYNAATFFNSKTIPMPTRYG